MSDRRTWWPYWTAAAALAVAMLVWSSSGGAGIVLISMGVVALSYGFWANANESRLRADRPSTVVWPLEPASQHDPATPTPEAVDQINQALVRAASHIGALRFRDAIGTLTPIVPLAASLPPVDEFNLLTYVYGPHVLIDDHDRCLQIVDRLEGLAERNVELGPRARCTVRLLRARSFRSVGAYDRTRDEIDAAAALLTALPYREIQLERLLGSERCMLAFELEQWEDTITLCSQVAERFGDVVTLEDADRCSWAFLFLMSSWALAERDEATEARRHLAAACDTYDRFGGPIDLPNVLLARLGVYRRTGAFGDAFCLIGPLAAALRSNPGLKLRAEAQAEIGQTWLMLGDVDEARSHLIDAADAYRALGNEVRSLATARLLEAI